MSNTQTLAEYITLMREKHEHWLGDLKISKPEECFAEAVFAIQDLMRARTRDGQFARPWHLRTCAALRTLAATCTHLAGRLAGISDDQAWEQVADHELAWHFIREDMWDNDALSAATVMREIADAYRDAIAFPDDTQAREEAVWYLTYVARYSIEWARNIATRKETQQ